MRLLHAKTKTLLEFFDQQIPEYAILSHTWGVGEVTFQDMQAFPRLCETKAGWFKIENCCRLALTKSLQYVWVDTCCIDKSSSAELSEAINSMFDYYRRAELCCVYLADVHTSTSSRSDSFDTEFSRSRWFRRGWTLQELLAPSLVWFYNSRWEQVGHIGLPDNFLYTSLVKAIHKVTGIRKEYLLGNNPQSYFAKASVAEKMSWAANRQTTRTEDMAYCLIGIFGVNMPLLYGEGERAFSRLQSKIIKTSGDHSFLAYQYGLPLTPAVDLLANTSPIFAASPKQFAMSGAMKELPWNPSDELTPFELTNVGLRIELDVIEDSSNDTIIALLHCGIDGIVTGLPLMKGTGINGYWRPESARPALISHQILLQAPPRRIYLQSTQPSMAQFNDRIGITVSFNFYQLFSLVEVYPPSCMTWASRLLSGGDSEYWFKTGLNIYLHWRNRMNGSSVLIRLDRKGLQMPTDTSPVQSRGSEASYSCCLTYVPNPKPKETPEFTLLGLMVRMVDSPSVSAQFRWLERLEIEDELIIYVNILERPAELYQHEACFSIALAWPEATSADLGISMLYE